MRVAGRRWVRRVSQALAFVGLGLVALLLALALTPPVSVTVAGQNVQVGAVAPTHLGLSWSGPGQAELFGEGSVDTVLEFAGPVRPRIVWQSFNRDAAAGAFIRADTTDGHRNITLDTSSVGTALARGWLTFFVRMVIVAVLLGAVLFLVAMAAVGLFRQRWRPRHPVRLLAASAAVSLVVATGSTVLTVRSAQDQLAGVATLAGLTGSAPLVPAPDAVGPVRHDVEVAVIGDSTAAGVGNSPLADPTALDKACDRSADAYARVLQSATGLSVANLACSSATISAGLLGTQYEGSAVIPAQVGVLKSIASLKVVIVSVGANDIGWSDFLRYCYGLARCDDQVSERLVANRLDTFRLQYAQLLQQLSALPTHPHVIVTGYYDPFGTSFDCAALQDPEAPLEPPAGYGFAADPGQDNQAEKIRQKIDPLRSELAQLNDVLAQGAQAFGFTSVQPSFEGHALCSAQPWVQGLSQPYPFHPNAAGELAIAAVQLPQLAAVMAAPGA